MTPHSPFNAAFSSAKSLTSGFSVLLLILQIALCEVAIASPTGSVTDANQHRKAFMSPFATLNMMEGLDFRVGQSIFEKIWVFAPSSTTASDGLGPLYNARSCSHCHQRNGRGLAPNAGEQMSTSLLFRLSIPLSSEIPEPEHTVTENRLYDQTGVVPEPTYGTQLQTFAYPGGKAEATVRTQYTEQQIALHGGEVVTLRQPAFTVHDLNYGNLHPHTLLSPRIASPIIGLGLIDAIPDEAINRQADPQDSDKDGISGRVNRVWDIAKQQMAQGRYGWKAGQPTLDQQNNAALRNDLGISNWLFPDPYGDCTPEQTACLEQAHGNSEGQDNLEASRKMTDALLFYTKHIAVPPRRNTDDPRVAEGAQI
ncbi:MAG: thiol oxidoreductase, partial [Pseudomonadales bacterium]|nr:thiol oxidoreductase [Pseudomonadales bacterium]